MGNSVIDTDVCVAGGGPAGLMLAVLLARQGIRVVLLEKHADFLRDFRGDTVHPSTLDLLDELGLGEAIKQLPHRDAERLTVTFADGTFTLADFSRLRVRHPYIRFMPQWHLLNLLADTGEKNRNFTLLRSHEVVDVTRDRGIVTGVRATGPEGEVRISAYLTVAADGRGSVIRDRLALPLRTFGAPMDVLWFRLPRRRTDTEGLDMRVGPGRLLLGIDRDDFWQIADVIPKGGFAAVQAAGLDAFRRTVADQAAGFADRVDQIKSWDDVKVLTVRVDRLRRWHAPGVLLIGDAAHAMSPIGGVGINLAVQDAVAAARILTDPIAERRLSSRVLGKVQRRRTFPTIGTQTIQVVIQKAFLGKVLAADRPVAAPRPLRVLQHFPALQAFPARLVGVGLRPERLG
jgi:2-polyprenyl-6-methoxyphenol hydroxylase-like FAD-dependent oxidoreductase